MLTFVSVTIKVYEFKLSWTPCMYNDKIHILSAIIYVHDFMQVVIAVTILYIEKTL